MSNSVTKKDNVILSYDNGVLCIEINKKQELKNKFKIRIEPVDILDVLVD